MSLAELFYTKNLAKQRRNIHALHHRRYKPLFRRRALLFEPLEPRLLLSAEVAYWIGGSGNWWDPTKWDIGVVPNDSGGNTYSVVIDQPSADPVITVDQDVGISGLTKAQSIQVQGGTLSVAGDLNQTGTIEVATGAELERIGGFTNSGTLRGTGTGTVTSSPAGITCGSDCSEAYPAGASVTLTATPDAGSTFTGWSVDGGHAQPSASTA